MFRETNLLFVDFVSLGKKHKTRFTVVKCLSCGQSKMLLNNPDYCLWVDRPEAQMEQQKQPGDNPPLTSQRMVLLSVLCLPGRSIKIRTVKPFSILKINNTVSLKL